MEFQDRSLPQLIHPKYGDGFVAKTPEEVEAAEAAGHMKCHNPTCGMMINPEAQQRIASGPGFYTCQRNGCKKSYHLQNEWPEYNPSGKTMQEMEREHNELSEPGANGEAHITGGIRRSGYNVAEVGEIGENLVEHLGSLPGYGPFTWWHQGGQGSTSPLDATTANWGVEIKSIDITSLHHRFIAGGQRKHEDGTTYNELVSKMDAAKDLNLDGVLGVFVLLNFYTSTADIYAKEFPNTRDRIGHFRTWEPNVKLIAHDVPFANPHLDPHSPSPNPIKPIEDLPF